MNTFLHRISDLILRDSIQLLRRTSKSMICSFAPFVDDDRIELARQHKSKSIRLAIAVFQ